MNRRTQSAAAAASSILLAVLLAGCADDSGGHVGTDANASTASAGQAALSTAGEDDQTSRNAWWRPLKVCSLIPRQSVAAAFDTAVDKSGQLLSALAEPGSITAKPAVSCWFSVVGHEAGSGLLLRVSRHHEERLFSVISQRTAEVDNLGVPARWQENGQTLWLLTDKHVVTLQFVGGGPGDKLGVARPLGQLVASKL